MGETNKNDKIAKLAEEIMKLSRNTLIVNMRFIDVAISRLKNHQYDGTLATNGVNIFYNPEYLIQCYKAEKELPVRDFFHMMMHCVFRHNFMVASANKAAWDLACDIAVENIINELDVPAMNTSAAPQQKKIISNLSNNIKYMTAEKIYEYLISKPNCEELINHYKPFFYSDDHLIWYLPAGQQPDASQSSDKSDDKNNNSDNQNQSENSEYDNFSSYDEQYSDLKSKLQKDWEEISKTMQSDLETFSKAHGNKAGSLMQNLNALNREKYDYSSFLKKFSVMGETMKINDDEFDYIFYTLGLDMYGNIPLIEPLEYKEVKKIKEFVIAIDTSGSVSGELVQNFVQKTYNILKQTENFFTKINLHIIQCDAEIQQDTKITSQEEFDQYIKNIKLHGFGGTDFRPVFSYVDQLIKNHEFTNLKGLIYFTDGYGTFPERQPDYHTAFIYIDDGYSNPGVPVWAIKLILDKNDI